MALRRNLSIVFQFCRGSWQMFNSIFYRFSIQTGGGTLGLAYTNGTERYAGLSHPKPTGSREKPGFQVAVVYGSSPVQEQSKILVGAKYQATRALRAVRNAAGFVCS